MNIFYLSTDPREAAEWMVDRHVVKMILESAQLLCTAHRIIDGTEYQGSTATGRKARRWKLDDDREISFYSATHINHPSAVWCRQSLENYNWLVDHLYGLIEEYRYRYGKVHKIAQDDLAYKLQSPPYKLENWDFTQPPPAMDKQYIVSDNPVDNYRNYYKKGKVHLHRWTKRSPPPWLNESV